MPDAELLSIAVNPNYHRQGVGQTLLEHAKRFMKDNNIEAFKVVAADTQMSALKFYRNTGGQEVSQTELGDLHSFIFVYSLT